MDGPPAQTLGLEGAEKDVMERLDGLLRCTRNDILARYYHTFRTMTSIEHTDRALPEDEYFCVNLKVKQRYINPLVIDPRVKPEDDNICKPEDNTGLSLSGLTRQSAQDKPCTRLYDVSEKARRIIDDFKSYQDTPYGCAKLI